ncbi:MAG: thioredoxin family protein [Parvibaculaceae bacterium]
MIELTQSDFHSRVEGSAILVVEFAVSAAPMEGPHPLSQRFPDATFARVDPVREPGIARMFGLAVAPALLIFREGIVLYLETGDHSAERIGGLLDRITALDLDKIRDAVAEERAKASVHMRRICPTALRGPFEP